MRAWGPQLESSPHSLQLEKAPAQQWRPSIAKKINNQNLKNKKPSIKYTGLSLWVFISLWSLLCHIKFPWNKCLCFSPDNLSLSVEFSDPAKDLKKAEKIFFLPSFVQQITLLLISHTISDGMVWEQLNWVFLVQCISCGYNQNVSQAVVIWRLSWAGGFTFKLSHIVVGKKVSPLHHLCLSIGLLMKWQLVFLRQVMRDRVRKRNGTKTEISDAIFQAAHPWYKMGGTTEGSTSKQGTLEAILESDHQASSTSINHPMLSQLGVLPLY